MHDTEKSGTGHGRIVRGMTEGPVNVSCWYASDVHPKIDHVLDSFWKSSEGKIYRREGDPWNEN